MQTASVLSALSAAGPTILRPPFTEAGGGDRSVNRAALEADGVFSEEIESALLAGEIDVAVHCLKDAPTIDTPGLTMSAYLRRDDIRDCLVARDPDVTLATLPAGGAKVATASLRRTAALRIHRPDINVVPLRGPVDERLRALHEPDSRIDALVVATCSMERLGLPPPDHRTDQPGGDLSSARRRDHRLPDTRGRQGHERGHQLPPRPPLPPRKRKPSAWYSAGWAASAMPPLAGGYCRTNGGDRAPPPTRSAPDPSRRTVVLRSMFAAPAATPGRRPWPSATN
ncbi:hypothetical protein GTV15_16765 [Streptomyces sp. SID7803]|nr:hypothetical protein [Streptomyces sp. SID7803]